MGSSSEEEDGFFDTREDLTSVSDSCSDGHENFDFSLRAGDFIPSGVGFQVWVKEPESILERRKRFLKWMGASASAEDKQEGYQDANCHEMELETETIMENIGAFLRNSSFDDGYSSSPYPLSYCSNEALELFDGALEEDFSCRINILDDCIEFIVDELGQDEFLRRIREVGTNRLIPVEEFESTLGLSHLIQQVVRREVQGFCNSEKVVQVKRGWLRRLGTLACIVDRKVLAGNLKSCDSHPIIGARPENVRVKAYKKRSKELSALCIRQDILAHEGSILTMKFSPDGKYLASAGEDRIVRVWQVTESGRSNELHVPRFDPSFVYFTVNHLSELVPLYEAKKKMGRLWSLRKTSDPTCVIFPRKVFSISKKPLHEFQGHRGDVLDLSWSKNKVTSSADYTVRLWQVGSDQCLKVFSHNNYVASVEFNPVDDNYFISGSIDGKVRIWAIPGCQVVDWTDAREIVTAVCYSPDGKGGIVGSMSGNCNFYDASDNCLQLYAQICLQGKKKSPFNRITGFQFSPVDPSKLMVSSADSHVRILHGIDVIGKVRAVRNSGSQIPASFTSDGIHIISASEDSNVYMWNYISKDESSQISSKWPRERFISNNVSVAIPWCGMTCGNSILSNVIVTTSLSLPRTVNQPRCGSENNSSADFSSSRGLFSDSLSKGFATWPEENLPAPSSLVVTSATCKSHYKFLKMSCQKAFDSPHAWGLVIVTGSLDGRIRSFQNYGLPTLI